MTPTALPLPNRRERTYLSAFRIAAVHISVPPSGPITIGAVHDLARAPPVVVAAWWCVDLAIAEAVVDQATGVDLRGRSARSTDAAAVAIVTAARRMGVRLSEHASVLARARMATKKIAERVEQATAAGDMKFFNLLFQQRRKAAALEGRKLDYGACRQRFEAALAHVAAGRMAGDPGGVTLDGVAMTFGER
jgi:hypothetical protein